MKTTAEIINNIKQYKSAALQIIDNAESTIRRTDATYRIGKTTRECRDTARTDCAARIARFTSRIIRLNAIEQRITGH